MNQTGYVIRNTCGQQPIFQVVITDNQSLKYRQALINALVELEDINTVASHFSHYVTQGGYSTVRLW